MRTFTTTLLVCLASATITVAALALPEPEASAPSANPAIVGTSAGGAAGVPPASTPTSGIAATGSQSRAADGGPLSGGAVSDGTVPDSSVHSGPVSNSPVPSSTDAPAVAPAVEIVIADFRFSAAVVTPGAVVTVRNEDSMPHSVTSADGVFDTGLIQPGSRATFTAPATAGSYQYLCSVHPSMTGLLTVI